MLKYSRRSWKTKIWQSNYTWWYNPDAKWFDCSSQQTKVWVHDTHWRISRGNFFISLESVAAVRHQHCGHSRIFGWLPATCYNNSKQTFLAIRRCSLKLENNSLLQVKGQACLCSTLMYHLAMIAIYISIWKNMVFGDAFHFQQNANGLLESWRQITVFCNL